MKPSISIIANAIMAGLIFWLGIPFAQADTSQATPAEQAGVSTLRQLDSLRSENAVLTEQLKNAELKDKLVNVGKKAIQPAVTMPSAPMMAPMMAPMISSVSNPQRVEKAYVEMVSGVGGDLVATISMPGGDEVRVRVGNHLPGIGIIKKITVDEVIAGLGGHDKSIPFAGGIR